MQIFYTEPVTRADLSNHLAGLPEASVAAIVDAGVPEGMPFVLRSDGTYDRVLNGCLRYLPQAGVLSPRSWRAYAWQLVLLATYVEGPCKRSSLLRGTLDDFEGYKSYRRNPQEPKVRKQTWNQQVAALEKYFAFALRQGLLTKVPFKYEPRTIYVNGHREHREVNSLYESVPLEEVVRCITIEEYEFFRDVGLGGVDPAGSGRRVAMTGRTCVRDIALAELLVTTGMRITEALALLREEMPATVFEGDDVASAVLLKRSITKGNKKREIWISHRVLEEHVDEYILTDRANATARARDIGRYDRIGHMSVVDSIDSLGVRVVAGRKTTRGLLEDLTPLQRRRLFWHDGGRPTEPIVIWCREDGLPLTDAAVRMNFKRACERCNTNDAAKKRFGHDLHVTPHTLRHTFAVAHLSQLVDACGLASEHFRVGMEANDYERFRRVQRDPLNELRRRLGHASVETTYKYLTYLEHAKQTVRAAIRQWDEKLGRPQIIRKVG